MADHARDERPAPARLQVHRDTARNWQYGPDEAEHDKQHQSDDVVGHRMEAHGEHAKRLEPAVAMVVAGQTAKQAPDHPGDERRSSEQSDRPWHGAQNE